ncbi:hypothetical protein EPYR_02309 [Erwinia pyrifoliae DSM 12163]|nr:hypothetical protein EPYR_02309 [Erwinia pyrifoliae DSM 12163]
MRTGIKTYPTGYPASRRLILNRNQMIVARYAGKLTWEMISESKHDMGER